MFRRQREFNIISGGISNNFESKRSRSCASQLQNYKKMEAMQMRSQNLRVPKDQKEFQYSYFDSLTAFPKVQIHKQTIKPQNFQNKTMLNYVSTEFNIINHSSQIETAQIVNKNTLSEKMPKINKISPLTEHFHRARMYAPNYHEGYQGRAEKKQFNRKIGLCTSLCGVQKTYGGRYFRKFK